MGQTLSSIARRSLKLCVVLVYLCAAGNAQTEGQENSPNLAIQGKRVQPRVTVAELTQLVEEQNGKRDGDAAKEIEHLQLTERLSSPKLATLIAELPGERSKKALMAVGDVSVFLAPPKAEIPKRSLPEIAEQRQIVSRTVDYLKRILPKLPDFYAKRFTNSFEEIRRANDEKGKDEPSLLQPAGEFKATVYYREGKEVVHADGPAEYGLITRGTFGPILSTVVVDAARSNTMRWSRWEEGPNGSMAVFRFQVPQEESHYELVFPAAIGAFGARGPTAYHGEIGIDPMAGTILRLLLEADPPLGSSMGRADIMVEYGRVVIGGKIYTCPVRSVSFSTGGSVDPERMRMGLSFARQVTRLDDVVFSDYHVFRTEMRILPD
jgi:hypothetical protein